MTHNQMIKCQYCNTHIRLRFTVVDNDIPFNILCPECKTEINGTIIINQEKPLKEDGKLNIHYDITNGIVDNAYSSTNKHFVAEQSIEFPTKKIYLYQNNQEPTPYIRAASIFGKDTISIIQRINEFLLFIENEWNNTKTLYKFYQNQKFDLLKNKLKPMTDIFEINNELDMLMALHQKLVISFNKILPNDTLNEFTSTANNVFNLFSSKKTNLLNFINYLEDQDIFKSLDNKQLDILDDFCKIYLKLMPAISLKIANKKIDYDNYGISTVGYEELKNFYSNTYEYILTYLDIIIGINNLEIRDDYNNVLSNSYKINKFTDLNSMNSKYNKINLIDIKEPYSKVIHLENRIRNSIAHYTVDLNNLSQEITFKDKYKENIKTKTLYLIQFAELCVENLYLVLYINEIAYNLRKIQLLNKGIVPSIHSKKLVLGKVGRNDPCPCGSGKKYKHCCINKQTD